MTRKRGTVYIAPSGHVPRGRMADPDTTLFWVSWQDYDAVKDQGAVIEDTDIQGAEAAIAWGRERSNDVLIRLGHMHRTYFSAGDEPDPSMPQWPPEAPPPEGWFTPGPDDS